VAVPLLTLVTVTVITLPGVALAGRSMVVVTSEINTANTAVVPVAFEPTLVTKSPARMVLVSPPGRELVTTTVIVQKAAAGTTAPIGTVSVPKPAVAAGVIPAQLD
jgi:hypothetical protein